MFLFLLCNTLTLGLSSTAFFYDIATWFPSWWTTLMQVFTPFQMRPKAIFHLLIISFLFDLSSNDLSLARYQCVISIKYLCFEEFSVFYISPSVFSSVGNVHFFGVIDEISFRNKTSPDIRYFAEYYVWNWTFFKKPTHRLTWHENAFWTRTVYYSLYSESKKKYICQISNRAMNLIKSCHSDLSTSHVWANRQDNCWHIDQLAISHLKIQPMKSISLAGILFFYMLIVFLNWS
jgi:hypothetical protein